HSVVGPLAEDHRLVPEDPHLLGGELLVGALQLLQTEHVGTACLEPGQEPVGAGPDGVDVPAGDEHRGTLAQPGPPRTRRRAPPPRAGGAPHPRSSFPGERRWHGGRTGLLQPGPLPAKGSHLMSRILAVPLAALLVTACEKTPVEAQRTAPAVTKPAVAPAVTPPVVPK